MHARQDAAASSTSGLSRAASSAAMPREAAKFMASPERSGRASARTASVHRPRCSASESLSGLEFSSAVATAFCCVRGAGW